MAVVVQLNERYLMRLVFGGHCPGPQECTLYLVITQFLKTSCDGIARHVEVFRVPVEKEKVRETVSQFIATN